MTIVLPSTDGPDYTQIVVAPKSMGEAAAIAAIEDAKRKVFEKEDWTWDGDLWPLLSAAGFTPPSGEIVIGPRWDE